MPRDIAGLDAIHAASTALASLRGGLTSASARHAVIHLKRVLHTAAVALVGRETLLAWHGTGAERHGKHAPTDAAATLHSGSPTVSVASCPRRSCPIRYVVSAPVTVDRSVVAALCVYTVAPQPVLVRCTAELATCIAHQLQLVELDAVRVRLAAAEMRALRPQVSPHFVFNSLTAISSFMRTDPDVAHELLQHFADLTRYSLRHHADLATLGEELDSVAHYVELERARFSDRLHVTVEVDADALQVPLPYLSVHALVENAIRHGMERKAGPGLIAIRTARLDDDIDVIVEDDGVGIDPERVWEILHGDRDDVEDPAGLGNVHRRLLRAFGDQHGLVVETVPGAGTRLHMRVPSGSTSR